MKHIQRIQLTDLVFLDIETARVVKKLKKDTPLYDSWEYFMRYKNDPRSLEESFEQDAALHAEFARVVCITVGTVKGGNMINLTTFYDKDEAKLLRRFNKALTQFTAKKATGRLAGHAIIDFDLPFILKRCIVNQVEAHSLIDVGEKKPWEVTTLDTKVLWKSTGARTSSLINIAVALGIPSPKDDISGADVGRVYYEEGDKGLERIVRYCEKDVVTTMRVYMRMAYLPDITDVDVSEIEIEEEEVPLNLVERIQEKGYLSDELKEEVKGVFRERVPDQTTRLQAIEVIAAAVCRNSELDKDTRKELLNA